MKLNPNCSEAIYRIKVKDIDKFPKNQLKIFQKIMISQPRVLSNLGAINQAYNKSGKLRKDWWRNVFETPEEEHRKGFEDAKKGVDFMYTPYFEDLELDLFLDYFNIPSQRSHWTTGATSLMDKKDYNKYMKLFIKKYKLKAKQNIKRYEDED